jgi:hypothetical protein
MKSHFQKPGKTVPASKGRERSSLAARSGDGERRQPCRFIRVALSVQDLQRSKKMYCEREKAVDPAHLNRMWLSSTVDVKA